jgi:hypothetical protein
MLTEKKIATKSSVFLNLEQKHRFTQSTIKHKTFDAAEQDHNALQHSLHTKLEERPLTGFEEIIVTLDEGRPAWTGATRSLAYPQNKITTP